LLFFDNDGNIVLKDHPKMVATSCECLWALLGQGLTKMLLCQKFIVCTKFVCANEQIDRTKTSAEFPDHVFNNSYTGYDIMFLGRLYKKVVKVTSKALRKPGNIVAGTLFLTNVSPCFQEWANTRKH
jgi:hypothetical protein